MNPKLLALLLASTACGNVAALPPALDPAKPATPSLIALGQQLFHEKRLSVDHSVSCASCHDLALGGADPNKAKSVGVGGRLTRRNSPTVLNVAGVFAFFWDGRAATLEEQAKGPLLSPDEMGSNPALVASTLASIPGYAAAFEAQWPGEPISLDHAAEALAAFQRQLRAPGRLDRFLAGELDALDAQEQRGLLSFRTTGCTQCHRGSRVGAERYELLGAANPWPDADTAADQGRFEVTGSAGDRLVFRIPPLRNVARTAPYFHDGSVETLEKAVELMGWHQLGVRLSPQAIDDLVAFLKTLDGAPPAELARVPELPDFSSQTPPPRAP